MLAKGDGHFGKLRIPLSQLIFLGHYYVLSNRILVYIPIYASTCVSSSCGVVWGSASVRVVRGLSRGGGGGLSLGGGGGGGSGDGVSDDSTVFDLELDPRAYIEGAGEELLGEQVFDLVLDDTP